MVALDLIIIVPLLLAVGVRGWRRAAGPKRPAGSPWRRSQHR